MRAKPEIMRKTLVASILLISTLALVGCTINLGNSATDEKSGMMNGNNSGSSVFSGADIMFAQMMIPHHQQAVDMGTLAETRALSQR